MAGDLLEKPTLEQRVATGFHRNTLRNTEAGVDLELYRTKENLTEFFDRFRHLNLRSDAQLDELVDQAKRVVSGVEPQLRQHVATELSAVQSALDGLLVDRPRRNILRRPK